VGCCIDKGVVEEGNLVGTCVRFGLCKALTSDCRTDAKPVSIVSLGCFHPVMKVQSASIHFFLGSDEEKEDSDEEREDVSIVQLRLCISF
jgi:hypothetical protein